jgi:hypothetical protein
LALSGFNAVMSPDWLMHTAPLYLPGTFIPLVSAVTVPDTLSAEGFEEAPFTYPGHFLALVATRFAALMVVVFPLTQWIVPPTANEVAVIGWVLPPVLAVPEHPLTVIVLLAFPVIVVQTTFPLGLGTPAAPAGLDRATTPVIASMAAVATNPILRNIG